MILRMATVDDVPAMLDVQEEGAVEGLRHIFPQDEYPFPREVLSVRWQAEIAAPDTEVYLYIDDAGDVQAFAAIRGDELLHLGTALATWGSGLASQFHDALLHRMAHGATSSVIRLRVFQENRRARRFYEKHGWRPTGVTSRTSFPPHPVLLEYQRALPLEGSGSVA